MALNSTLISRLGERCRGLERLEVRGPEATLDEAESRAELDDIIFKLVKAHSETLQSLKIGSDMINLPEVLGHTWD